MDISFIFRLDDDPATYYGKILLNRWSDDHEGVDRLVRAELRTAVNKYRQSLNFPELQKIYVGILGTTSEWSSSKERFIFDIYINQMYTNLKKHSFTYEGTKMYYYDDHDSDSDEDDVDSELEDDGEDDEDGENIQQQPLLSIEIDSDDDSDNEPSELSEQLLQQ